MHGTRSTQEVRTGEQGCYSSGLERQKGLSSCGSWLFYTWVLCNYNQRGGGRNAGEVDGLGPCALQVGVFEAQSGIEREGQLVLVV